MFTFCCIWIFTSWTSWDGRNAVYIIMPSFGHSDHAQEFWVFFTVCKMIVNGDEGTSCRMFWYVLIRSTPPNRPNKVGLKYLSIHTSVLPSIRPSVRPQKVSSISMKFGGRGRRLMHDGMQYDPIQGQAQGREPLKVRNLAIFKGYLLPHS